MHIGVPTARHTKSPARQLALSAAGQGDLNGFEPQTSAAVDHLTACDDLIVATERRIGPHIDHGGNGNALSREDRLRFGARRHCW